MVNGRSDERNRRIDADWTGEFRLTQRNRKLAGVFLFIALLIAYPLVATIIYETTLTELPTWALLIYFCIAGMGWALPAGVLIKWMSRPDEA